VVAEAATSSAEHDRPGARRAGPHPGRKAARAIRAATGRVTVVVTVTALAAVGVTATIAARQTPRVSGLLMQGIAADPCQPSRVLPVPAGIAAWFEPGSSVARTPGGVLTARGVVPLAGAQGRCVATAVAASRHWLQAGLVPGVTVQQRSMATRALLDLRLSVRPDGAVVAAWHGDWRYAWPRDSSWVVAALAGTGHLTTAFQVLRFLQRVQRPDGTWAARYRLDGSPVRDGRPAELDATGWVPWAVWSWAQAAERAGSGLGAGTVRRDLAQLWPMVAAAANAATRSLSGDGLPGPAMDYWEDSVQVTLGTAAPLLAGLRAAADLAAGMGTQPAGRRWAGAAARLSAAVQVRFGRTGYQRTPSSASGADAAITFLGPPLAVPSQAVRRAVQQAQDALRQPNGGLLPGAAWTGSTDVAWTAETAFFALFDAGTGRSGAATGLLSWLAGHRTRLGELPEQVNADGKPVAVAPLDWTDAVVLLTLLAQAHRLPTVPVPARS
jgi:glucoamylase